MPIRLDKIPAPLPAPPALRAWIWLLLLAALLLLGAGLTLWWGREALAGQPTRFWLIALGAPLLTWCALVFVRLLVHLGKQSVTDGWNEQRQVDLVQKLRQGRRSQQILAVSLHTALRELEAADGKEQQLALLRGQKALTVQADWLKSEEGARHSRLAVKQDEKPEMVLRRILRHVLGDVAKALAKLPQDRPLAVLVEMNSSIPEECFNTLWQEVWAEAGIRQSATRLDGCGLSVVDHWLDQRIRDQALLLVVALQLAPAEVAGSAESAVGILLGNRLTQTVLQPLAYLHRPEPAHAPTAQALRYAVCQALDWVPVSAPSIRHVWRVAINPALTETVASVANEVALPGKSSEGLHDLDVFLGNPGCAAPWLAIASAVESQGNEATPHFIFSGDSTIDGRLWCSVVMPASVHKEQAADGC